MENDFSFSRTETFGFTICHIGGAIIGTGVAQLRGRLIGWLQNIPDGIAPQVIIDLTQVSSMMSKGVGILVGAFKVIHNKGGVMVIIGANRMVRGIMAITKLDRQLIKVYDNIDNFMGNLAEAA